MIRPLTVCIIDDDEDDKELFCEVLEQVNSLNKCINASSGYEALQLLHQSQILPDFIFLDLNMPRMNGIQLLKQLKASERFASIPVIIYSTSNRETDKEETKRLGANCFLTKPSSMPQLKEKLQFLFETL